MVLTMAAPAGLVTNPASGSNRPPPFGSSASASTNCCLGGSPVTAAWTICTRPWSNSVTCVAGLESFPANVSCTTFERLQVLDPVSLRDRVRNIGDALRRLSHCNGIEHLVFERVDRGRAIGVFQSDIDPRSVTGRP